MKLPSEFSDVFKKSEIPELTYPAKDSTQVFIEEQQEIPQRASIFKVNWCLEIHNAHLKN